MIRFLIRTAILLASVALGLLVADWVVDGVELTVTGFVVAVVVFTVAQAVLSPFIAKMAARYAPAFLGGIGLVSTFVALLIASAVGDGLSIDGGFVPWLLTTLVVWLVTALATFLLPMFFLKEKAEERKQDGAGPAGR
ncbi:phage holin family protein [Cellulosimicrobium marinum]|uniref:phage holin family protein n=1 Tax=Cellulosimicrobium marinum TaxID=1638992 RepID=UPI001E372F68|nr:phage holin family protein [Cellulosimicrobium marinum]MCB7137910.1 phage holin family protein [Cellulosimicrobium marinum]